MEPFVGARLKIKRAKEHILNLRDEFVRFQASDLHTITIKKDPNTGNDFLEAAIVKAIPDEFGCIIGDALHNLKAALDFTVNEIVFSRLREWDDYTRFPIREDREKLIAAVNGGKISKASKAVSDLIVDCIKPHYAGNDALWRLHRLNILDKHRLLLPVMQINGINDICIEHDRGKEFIGTWVITRTRTATHDLGPWRNVKITNKGSVALLIVFDKGLLVSGLPILPTLNELLVVVRATVDKIAEVFLAESKTSHSKA